MHPPPVLKLLGETLDLAVDADEKVLDEILVERSRTLGEALHDARRPMVARRGKLCHNVRLPDRHGLQRVRVEPDDKVTDLEPAAHRGAML